MRHATKREVNKMVDEIWAGGVYCPFRIFGNGTQCKNGVPFRAFDIKPDEGIPCQAWDGEGCTLCYFDYGKRGAP